MSEVNFDPQLYIVRFYAGDKSFESLDTFDAVLTLHKVENLGYIAGMHGSLNRAAYTKFMAGCKELGITKLIAFRGQGKKAKEWDI